MNQMKNNMANSGRVLFLKELSNAKSAAYWLNGIFLTGTTIWVNVFAPIENINSLVSIAPEVAIYMAKISSQVYALIQPLWVFLLIWMFLSSEVFINEKRDGRLEMLLTTPLKLKEIWNSKRNALLILIYPITLLLNTLVFLLQKSVWETQLGINPNIQLSTITLAFLIAPIMGYCIGSLMGLLSFLVSNPVVLQTVNFVIVFVLGFVGNYYVSGLVKDSGKDLMSWRLIGSYTGVAVAIWLLTFFLSKKLDKDYVVSHFS